MVRGALYSCALLGRFAIGARVSLLWQHCTEREMSASAYTGWFLVVSVFFFSLLFLICNLYPAVAQCAK